MKAAVFGLLLVVFNQLASADDLAEAEKSAEALMQLNHQKTGSPEAVDQNLVKPLMTGKPMSTLDGQRQFSAQVDQYSSQELLKLALQPLPSGDVKILSIFQNMAGTGKADCYMQPNLIVSGICANGFIRCDPGTWNNCHSFKWTVNDAQQLATQPVPLAALGGCYCINNSCGTGLAWSNLNDILSHLGGGAIGAMVENRPTYSIRAPKISDITITYFGHDGGERNRVNVAQISKTPEIQPLLGYAKNPQRMEELKATQAKTDPLWQLLEASQSDKTSLHFIGCKVERLIPVNPARPEEIIRKIGGNGTFQPFGNNTLKISMGDDSNKLGNHTMYEDAMTLEVLKPDRIVFARLKYARFDDWLQVLANNMPVWSGPYNNWWDPLLRPPGPGELNMLWKQHPETDFTQHLKNSKHFQFKYRLEVTNCGCGYLEALIGLDTTEHLDPDQIINECANYENNREYLLVDETIDGVNTFKRHAKTGLNPVAQTRTIRGTNTTFEVTRDWFHKERRYVHNLSPQKFNFDFDRTRYIQEQSIEQHYHDRYQAWGSNQLHTTQGDLFLTAAKPYTECTPTCKTKKPRPQNDVYNDRGHHKITGEKQRHPVTYDFFYRPCYNNVCQMGPEETLVKPCQCLQEFGEAASMMQLLRMAGNDLICSTGATENLGVTTESPEDEPTAKMPEMPPELNPNKQPKSDNWVCGKEQEDDGIARLQPCLASEAGAQLCPVDAIDCQPVEGSENRFSCPLGELFACITTKTSTTPRCSPHQCINMTTAKATETIILDGKRMANDGRRNAEGECLDQLYIFSGATGFCRTPGLQTAWKNCCKNHGKVVSDSTGSGSMKIAVPVISAIFKSGKAAYQAFRATQGGAAVAAKAGAVAAKKSLLVGFDPATIAASIAVGFVMDYLTSACGESDMNTALLNGSGFCVEVGRYCKQKFPLIGCVQRAKSFCCFSSKMARIIQQQGRQQLKAFNGFGSAENPQCRGFTPEEFQSLDFSQMDLAEYFEDLQRTLLPEMQQKMETKMQEYMQQTNQ